MVLQLVLPARGLSSFYGFLMNEKQSKQDPEKKILRSKELFGDEKIVFIEHEKALYRLMITRQGKLILNK